LNYIIQIIILAIFLILFINWLSQKSFQKKLNSLQAILITENNPDKYIEENTKLLETTKNLYNKSLIYINISAGHAVKKSYRKSKEALKNIPEKGLRGINRVVYFSNLAYYHFKLAETKEAIKIVEDNKKESILELKKAVKLSKVIEVRELKRKYPLGEERILIEALFHKEISKEEFPINKGYLIQNIGTIFAIYQATFLGKALIDRIVTISGNGIKEAKNLKMKIGTPVEEIKRYLEMKIDTQKIVIGGPMTGKTIYDENTVIWKNTGALLFLNKEEINVKKTEPCINCGICVDKCPMGLMPLKFEQFYFVEEFKEALEYNVFDCIECGVCTYVCPSNRPLLESIFLIKKKLKEVEYD